MCLVLRTMLVVSLLAASTAARAQSVDPSGHWEGAITIPGGEITSVDQGGIEFPLGLTQQAGGLTLNTPAIGGDFYAGVLNANGELAGTFTQGQATAPLTFVRSK